MNVLCNRTTNVYKWVRPRSTRRVFTEGNLIHIKNFNRMCIMSTYAIIKTGGKQVKVEVGQAIYVEKINAEAGSEVTFNEVFLSVVIKL